MDGEIRELIRRMALENDWGAPRIHGELEKLGFTVSEATVSRHMPRRPASPDVVQQWLSFLRNHKECIAAMDFFTVPTASFGVDDLVVQLPFPRRRPRQRLGLLRPHLETTQQPAQRGHLHHERHDLHLGLAVGAQQRIHLVYLLDQTRARNSSPSPDEQPAGESAGVATADTRRLGRRILDRSCSCEQ